MKIDTKGAGQTGTKPTANAGLEQGYPVNERIITDDLAPKMFSRMNGFWIKISKYAGVRNFLVNLVEKTMPGGWSMFLVRKRYIDTKLRETLKDSSIKNIVNLGAGMDTRLYRFPEPRNFDCFEMDQDWLYKSTVKKGLWIASFDPSEINPFLKKYGWELIEDITYNQLDEAYVKPTGRKLGVCEVERVVFAKKI